MSAVEFSRPIKVRSLPAKPIEMEAGETERAGLAARFGLSGVDALSADITLEESGKAIVATGTLYAEIVQACAVSGEDFEVTVEEPLALRFVEESDADREPALEEGEIEIELSADELDEIVYTGDTFDLGEAVAQSLGLAIDPYAEGPGADAARARAGITSDDAPSGPLAEALAALKKD